MRSLKIGSRGPDVQSWQTFLRGGQIDDNGDCTAAPGDAIVSDGIFGPATDRQTKAWQINNNLAADGIVGPNTWAVAVKDSYPQAAVPDGTITVDTDTPPDPTGVGSSDPVVDKSSPSWPPRPDWATPLVTDAQRNAVLGMLTYVAAPTDSNPEAVHITNNFVAENTGHANIPQLSAHPIAMHKLAVPQFEAWFQAIEVKGLSDRVIGFAGCWVPRFVRGSRTRLSNHAWGSAIDFAVPYNKRGHQPALLGQKGCVRELAEFCYDFGIFWGGAYQHCQLDGMHWEIFKILTPAELAAAKAKHGVV